MLIDTKGPHNGAMGPMAGRGWPAVVAIACGLGCRYLSNWLISDSNTLGKGLDAMFQGSIDATMPHELFFAAAFADLGIALIAIGVGFALIAFWIASHRSAQDGTRGSHPAEEA